MAGTNRNLTVMLLPQSWDGHQLVANLLLLPNGDPTVPVPISGGPELAFSKAQPVLRATLLSGIAVPPWDPSVNHATLPHIALTLTYSSAEDTIFTALAAQYTPNLPPLTQPGGRVVKDLPHSYLEATGFQTPDGNFFTTGDGFICSLSSATSKPNTTPVTARTIAWGEVLSFALRQPLVAEAMGLLYRDVPIPLTAAQAAAGGWIWVEIDNSDTNNWYAKLVNSNAAAVSTYAARIPALTTPQDVFAAVLFPTVKGNYISKSLDDAQGEADVYLDGFAKIVHVNQPVTADAASGSDSIPPGTDAGIQIGWDDEQVTTWINRQINIAQGLAAPPPPPVNPIAPEVPFTVLGYRVDVRKTDADPWSSLCAADVTVNAADVFSTSVAGQELCVEPTPVQNGTGEYWLPRYFSQWRGRTLVVSDPYAYAFSGGQPPATTPPSDSQFTGTASESLPAVGLRFGDTYQFRTRLTDLTGGGPLATDPSPADAGTGNITFKRWVPPKKVQFDQPADNGDGTQTLSVDRPLINYPEMVFAGAADQGTLDALLAVTPPQPPVGTPPPADSTPFQAALLDPDVEMLEIIVEAEVPTHDTGNPVLLADGDVTPNPEDLDGTYRVVYTWQIPFPAIATPVSLDASTPVDLILIPTETKYIDSAPKPNPGEPTLLPIPTGRNIRLRLRGLGAPDINDLYFGNAVARTGLIADLRLRYDAATESGVIEAGNIDQQLRAYYLRNLDTSSEKSIITGGIVSAIQASGGSLSQVAYSNLLDSVSLQPSTPVQLLASALDLQVNGLTLSSVPGRRVVFGAQSSLRCTIPQDRSSITFSTQKDLINHWIVVQQLRVDRDWTWRGLAQNGPGQTALTFLGATAPAPHEVVPAKPAVTLLGQVNLPYVVSSFATQPGAPNQRDFTDVIFFSTIDSTVPPGKFPTPVEGFYELQATLSGDPTNPVGLWSGEIMVPIAAAPRQTPQIVSAGLAESDYVAAPDYSSTEQRQRALWIEFDQPPEDSNDAYFVRVENYGPDPLLISFPSDLPSAQDDPIALDPEPIRTILPDSANDDAGLAAMVQLIPSASSPVHYLVPLPSGISAPALDLFGFWTYEVRCGHLHWSTAQARFGRPLRIAGVQHPCPPLTVNVDHVNTVPSGGGAIQPCIACSAELAQTVLNGVSLTLPSRPQTQIWFLLYAQLRRADGEAYRNLLLGKVEGIQPVPTKTGAFPSHSHGIPVYGAFSEAEVDKLLATLRLPPTTSLSVLAVELFNIESQVIQEQVPKVAVEHGDAPRQVTSGKAEALQAKATATASADPLGRDLGMQRILRVSPLVAVRATC
jgi:hypothetical protein